MKFCIYCGHPMEPTDKFCPACGKPIAPDMSAESLETQVMAVLDGSSSAETQVVPPVAAAEPVDAVDGSTVAIPLPSTPVNAYAQADPDATVAVPYPSEPVAAPPVSPQAAAASYAAMRTAQSARSQASTDWVVPDSAFEPSGVDPRTFEQGTAGAYGYDQGRTEVMPRAAMPYSSQPRPSVRGRGSGAGPSTYAPQAAYYGAGSPRIKHEIDANSTRRGFGAVFVALLVVAAIVALIAVFGPRAWNGVVDKFGPQPTQQPAAVVDDTEQNEAENESADEPADEGDATEDESADESADEEATEDEEDADKEDEEKDEEKEEEEKPEGNTPPSFGSISASSELPGDSYTSYYGANNALDGDYATAWNEGASGNGEGQTLTLSAGEPQLISGVTIVGGYPKSEEVYYNNARPKDVTIMFDDGTQLQVTLDDSYARAQTFTLEKPVASSTITIRVDSVYVGDEYEDLAIAEVSVF